MPTRTAGPPVVTSNTDDCVADAQPDGRRKTTTASFGAGVVSTSATALMCFTSPAAALQPFAAAASKQTSVAPARLTRPRPFRGRYLESSDKKLTMGQTSSFHFAP